MRLRTLGVLAVALAFQACRSPVGDPPTSPESVFFLVRHAEKADQSEDPPLTQEGHARARNLAELLQDAGVEKAYTSDFARTRETAAPLASDLGLKVALYDLKELVELADTLLSTPGRYLVVGHSDTTPELAGLLGGEPGPPISANEYDRLYVLCRRPGAGTSTVTLRLRAAHP